MTQTPTLDCETAMGAALSDLSAAVCNVAAVPTWMLSAREIPSAVQAIAQAETRLAAARLALIREGVNQGVPGDTGHTPAAWLRALLNTDPRTANEDARVAAALADADSPVAAALAAGSISMGHARVITRTVAQLRSAKVASAQLAKAEQLLLEHAVVFDPLLLSRLARNVRYHLQADPDRDDLEKEERRQTAQRELTFYEDPDGSGMTHIRGRLDPWAAAIVQAALDPLAAPKPAADGTLDGRSAARRRADALVQLCEQALAGDHLPAQGGERTTVVVSMFLDTLLHVPGRPALLPNGLPLSAAAARKAACDAGIVPIVLGSASEPLDVGRRTRLWPAGLRRAIVQRDGGCSRPGCDRPPQWCQIHHILHWADGGPTSLHNAVMVCDRCHDLLHHGGWSVTIGADGLPVWTAPPWTHPPAPGQLRNTWWQSLRLLHDEHRGAARQDGDDP
jgi:Domain of unknown function (DUF222)/HNH endonuclease